jgi:hypothetical protein
MLMFVRAGSRRIHAISLGISRLGQLSATRILEKIEGFLNIALEYRLVVFTLPFPILLIERISALAAEELATHTHSGRRNSMRLAKRLFLAKRIDPPLEQRRTRPVCKNRLPPSIYRAFQFAAPPLLRCSSSELAELGDHAHGVCYSLEAE